MEHEIEFINGDPPPPARNGGRTGWRAAVIDQLKERPGVWALVETDAWNSNTSHWRKKGCETVCRRNPNIHEANRAAIYARWPAN